MIMLTPRSLFLPTLRPRARRNGSRPTFHKTHTRVAQLAERLGSSLVVARSNRASRTAPLPRAPLTSGQYAARTRGTDPQTLPPETSQDGLRNSLDYIRGTERLKPTEVVRAHGERESRSGTNPQSAALREAETGRRDVHYFTEPEDDGSEDWDFDASDLEEP